MSLAESLEAAAAALPAAADSIRDANGDPHQLLSTLDAEATTRVLAWLLANESDAAAELTSSWLEDERGTASLLQIEAAELPKTGRKVLRRALHRLRSQGIATPTDAPKVDRVARLPEVEDDLAAAYVTGLDRRGSRLVLLVEANPSGGARLFEAVLDDVGGIIDFQVYSAGRSRIRGFVKEATRRGGPQAVAVDGDAVKLLIERAAAQHPSDRPLPRAFSEWKLHLAPPEGAKTPGEAVLAELGVDEPTLAQQSRVAELVRGGELGPWPPGREQLQTVGDSVSSGGEAKLVVSASAREARVDAAVEAAAEQLFDEAHAARTAARLEESAFILASGGKQDDARACLAVAATFRGEAPQQGVVARAMVEILLAPLLESLRSAAEDGEERKDEGSLLVEP